MRTWTRHFSCFKPLSVTSNSIGARTAAAGSVDAAVVTHVAPSGRSRTDAIWRWWERERDISHVLVGQMSNKQCSRKNTKTLSCRWAKFRIVGLVIWMKFRFKLSFDDVKTILYFTCHSIRRTQYCKDFFNNSNFSNNTSVRFCRKVWKTFIRISNWKTTFIFIS